jgi:hypothetical protein
MSAIDLILRYGRQGVPPTFQRDFAGVKTLDHGTGPAITFTRASNATFFDANGTLQTAANDTPRFDHDPASAGNPSRGLLIEESRTNSIRNSQAGGAVVGVSGTAPTNWDIVASGSGLVREIVGSGVEDGLTYIDVKFSGTGSSDPIIQIRPETTTGVVSAVGQTWTASYYLRLVAGSTSGITSFATVWQERDATGASLTVTTSASFAAPTSAALKTNRISVVRTLTDASAVRLTNRLQITCQNAPIDITLRIAAPQLEQGAFSTSYIPTTNAAATRAADSAVVTPISSFYNQAEGTLFAEALRVTTPAASTFPIIASLNDGTVNNRIAFFSNSSRALRGQIAISGVFSSMGSSSAYTESAVFKLSLGYQANNHAFACAGEIAGTNTSVGVPVVSSFSIGADGGVANLWNGHIRKLAYWPKRLSNTLLQQLTT